MILGYVAVCVAVFTLWPSTDENVVVATSKTIQESQEAAQQATETAVAATTETTTTTATTETVTVQTQPETNSVAKDDMTLLDTGSSTSNTSNLAQLVATADHVAETVKSAATTISTFFRPNLSAIGPAKRLPAIAPKMTHPTANPNMESLISK